MWLTRSRASTTCGESCLPTTAWTKATVPLMGVLFCLVVVSILGRIFPRSEEKNNKEAGWRRAAIVWTFGAMLGLAVALALLVMADVVDSTAGPVRDMALRLVVPALLFLLVCVAPWLECGSVVSCLMPCRRLGWMIQLGLFGLWLLVFWSVGNMVPRSSRMIMTEFSSETLIRACLERVGVVGISLMAFLSGFASVSAPWHTFLRPWLRRRRVVTDDDVGRRKAGLDSATDMLVTKRHLLRRLERRVDVGGEKGLVGNVLGLLRGGSQEAEMGALRVDIAALEEMEAGLAVELDVIRSERAASTRLGKILSLPTYVFSLYCLYRITTTTLTTSQRILFPSNNPTASLQPSTTNPIIRLFSQATPAHLLDQQAALNRTLTFLTSGLVLVAGARSATATLRLLSRCAPRRLVLLQLSDSMAPLAVAQTASAYALAAAMLLLRRFDMHAATGGGRAVLGAALAPAFVDACFDACFLAGVGVSALGVAVVAALEVDDGSAVEGLVEARQDVKCL
ncbi:hypothetical protein XA68_11085 [Ophiocordyceps unilateralis]|uniref:Abscisic acid G-protein coupled receptor-like domain-containing protein n=1 Tax=Ophiocordyceps unilateralis TaxID=268505 RepID=A0A2A9NYA3_OPHUN|nr:hypothetical protein XA68_11085 [Ophiocordyceps unilateralis]